MHIIKLNAIDSTNSFLRQLSLSKSLDDFTVVTTAHQTKGRGQVGTQWQSEASKNLMFSVFKTIGALEVSAHFYISMAVSLAVFKALESLQLKQLKIKWPNDILSEQHKICGILIENVIKNNAIQSSIIGIGLNVNQTNFTDLPKASSIKNLTGKEHHIETLLESILTELKYFFNLLDTKKFDTLHEAYISNLYRIHKPSTFKDAQGNQFSGFIKGVDKCGLLQVEIEGQQIKTFDLKDISLLS